MFLLYVLVAMLLEKIQNIVKLVDRLKLDLVFRYNCGFNLKDDGEFPNWGKKKDTDANDMVFERNSIYWPNAKVRFYLSYIKEIKRILCHKTFDVKHYIMDLGY
ncbi:hypothetical protein [Thermoanaerobacterium thermosulfurigenes]|uniref:hypothetical protein n=1 Tax=Thermoanaerobacterium thermosulfurigenes TaxID=33950 RepID=UPI003EF107B5